MTQPWLVVVDPQVIFADPGHSPWASPMWADVLPRIVSLTREHAGRVVLTRYVADPRPQGSWRAYADEWPFAQAPSDDPLYAIVPELASLDAPVVTRPTFGKWCPDLSVVVGEQPHLILTGVSTDCCVISTALAAADAGATVTVRSDACAGSSIVNHWRALEVMALFGPHLTVERR